MGLEDPRSNGNVDAQIVLVIAQVVLEQLGVPAGGPAVAGGVVAGGQAHGRAVAGDVASIAFNAQVVTILAQIVAAEASWRGVSSNGTETGKGPWLGSVEHLQDPVREAAMRAAYRM